MKATAQLAAPHLEGAGSGRGSRAAPPPRSPDLPGARASSEHGLLRRGILGPGFRDTGPQVGRLRGPRTWRLSQPEHLEAPPPQARYLAGAPRPLRGRRYLTPPETPLRCGRLFTCKSKSLPAAGKLLRGGGNGPCPCAHFLLPPAGLCAGLGSRAVGVGLDAAPHQRGPLGGDWRRGTFKWPGYPGLSLTRARYLAGPCSGHPRSSDGGLRCPRPVVLVSLAPLVDFCGGSLID